MFQIVSDGSCDLEMSLINQYHIHVVPFYITKDMQTYQKENVELDIKDFYRFMVDNPQVFPKTSMPAIEDYRCVFEQILKQGEDIICLCITTKFSGSYNSAQMAKQILQEEYPQRNIAIIDTTMCTVLQGLLVLEACRMRDHGHDFQQAVQDIERIKSTGRIFFTVGNFEYLIHGGRIGKVAGVAAKTLGIKPLIVLHDGEIFALGVARGREKTKQKVISHAVQYFQEQSLPLSHYRICVGYGYDQNEGLSFQKDVEEALSHLESAFDKPLLLQQIGATIGVHTGPYPIGIGLIEKYDKNNK